MTISAGPSVGRPKRPSPVLICAKCTRRADFGRAITKAVKAELSVVRDAGRKPRKLVQTWCMGLCPKRAVTLASGATLVRGEMLIVREVSDVAAAVRMLCKA